MVALVLIHAGIGAVWLGAMAYSLLVVQPRAHRFFADPLEYEQYAATVAAGARWKVLAMMAALALTGAALAWLGIADGRPAAWTGLVIARVLAALGHPAGRLVCDNRTLWPTSTRRRWASASETPASVRT